MFEEEDNSGKMSDGYNTKNIALRVQKKLLGKMSSKKIAKMFIDDTSARLLDNVYRLAKEYSNNNKKIAEKVMKDIIKTVIKVGILYHNEQFTSDEISLADKFKRKFHTVCMTVVSFYEVDFSYDRNFLITALNECRAMLKELVQPHLTEKSLGRIDNVFNFFTDQELLEALFRSDGDHRARLGVIVEDLNKLLDSDVL